MCDRCCSSGPHEQVVDYTQGEIPSTALPLVEASFTLQNELSKPKRYAAVSAGILHQPGMFPRVFYAQTH